MFATSCVALVSFKMCSASHPERIPSFNNASWFIARNVSFNGSKFSQPLKVSSSLFFPVGSFECVCSPGYAGPVNGCQDIDECSANNGGCSQECVNRRKSRLFENVQVNNIWAAQDWENISLFNPLSFHWNSKFCLSTCFQFLQQVLALLLW